MNKRIILALFLIVFVISISALVQDLPDVEIFGPSELKSILEKKTVLNSDLLLNDIVDSLRPILPSIPPIEDPVNVYKKYSLYLDINTTSSFHSYLTADSVLAVPLSIKTFIEQKVLKKDWSDLSLKFYAQYQSEKSKFITGIKALNSYSPYVIDNQSVNSIKLHYMINQLNLFNKNVNMHIKAEIQSTSYENPISDNTKNKMYMNHNIGINFSASEDILVGLEAFYAYNTPLISVSLDFVDREDMNDYSFFKSILLYVSDKNIVPGIHLSKRTFLNKNNYIQLYQKSDVEIWDNYNLLINQPWQMLQTDALISFKPVNTHIIFSNKSLSFNGRPICLNADAGVQYLIDEPVYIKPVSDLLINALPLAEAENVLKSNIKLNGAYDTDGFSFSQSVSLEKGWVTTYSNATLPYLPLLTLDTDIEYNVESFKITNWLKQYYSTKTEEKEYLRESFDLGAKVEYNITPDFTIFIEGQNLLNKGKINYRTVPTEPASAMIGLLYIF